MRSVLTINLLAVTALVAGCGGSDPTTPPLRVVRDDPSGVPMAGLTAAEEEVFDRGDALFAHEYRATQGLGPLYIRASCESCHGSDGRGPGFVERAIVVGADGYTPVTDQSTVPYGPVLRPFYVAPATRGVTLPDGVPNVLRSTRVGPPVFGRGAMEAVDASELDRVAREESAAGRVHGRVARLADGRVGRFGLKARVATLLDFAADAFRGDMGLTSPTFPDEVPNPDGVTDDQRPGVDLDQRALDDVGAYLRALAIPRREGLTDAGRAAFERARCGDCHTPTLRTSPTAQPAVLAGTAVDVYTDMLLHDMGAGLADGAAEGDAGPRDWRTAPLMGLRFARAYLHDGRARTLDDAVRMHRGDGSDANGSVDAYAALSETERAALLAFLQRL